MSPPPEQRPASRPTLEDLLQLKRNERPPSEFWDSFNRGLREKQLAALVHQPRGWERLRPLFSRALRWSVPVGAAAIATFGVVRHVALTPASSLVQAPADSAIVAAQRPVTLGSPTSGLVSSTVETTRSGTARDPLAEIPDVRTFPATVLAEAREGVSVREINSVSAPASPATTEETRPSTPPLVAVAYAAAGALQQPVEFMQARFNATADLGQQVVRSLAGQDASAGSGWNERDANLLEVSALDLRVSSEYAGNLMSTPVSYSPQTKHQVRLSEDERDYRDAVSRVGVQGSSLTIRF